MSGRRESRNELNTPPVADSNPDSFEVLRVWAAPGTSQQLTINTCWDDPAAWGLLLADIARHAARAYEHQGLDRAEVLDRILEGFDAERSLPTDDTEDLTGD